MVEQPVLDAEGNPVMEEVTAPDGTVTEVPQMEIVQQTVTLENSAGPLGYGNITLALGLAEATLPEGATFEEAASLISVPPVWGGATSFIPTA